MRDNDWKSRLGVVFSTNPDYAYTEESAPALATLPPSQQRLRVSYERKGRGGKAVTLVRGFVGHDADLAELGRQLKTGCGIGGSVKDGEIILQGDLRIKAVDLLRSLGYTQTK